MNTVRTGLRENLPQFSLPVVVNAFVCAMVGMERTILAPIAEQEFHLASKSRCARVGPRGERPRQGGSQVGPASTADKRAHRPSGRSLMGTPASTQVLQ